MAALAEDFPDLTVSKLRYLEDMGVVVPQRTPRGSRRYSEADLDRLRAALRMQRDQFLPLSVIREVLDEEATWVAGSTTPADDIGTARSVTSASLRTRTARAMSADELCERSGLDRQALTDLERFGLVTERTSQALEICRIVARLRTFGIEPRHLRAFRVAADREIGLVEQALAPHRKGRLGAVGGTGGAGRAETRELTGQLLALCIELHIALVRAGLP